MQRKDSSAYQRLRREIYYEGIGTVVGEGIVRIVLRPLYFLLKWPFLAIGFVLRTINAPVRRFSASRGVARRMHAFFDQHPIVTGIVEGAIVFIWFLPVIAFAVHKWHTLFGRDIAMDIRDAWLLVGLGAGALAIGGIGNLPIAEAVVSPVDEVDLSFVVAVFGMAIGPPVVLALWAYGLL